MVQSRIKKVLYQTKGEMNTDRWRDEEEDGVKNTS